MHMHIYHISPEQIQNLAMVENHDQSITCDEDGAGVKNRKDFLRTRFSFIRKRKDYLWEKRKHKDFGTKFLLDLR